MTDLCLKFQDEAAAISALESLTGISIDTIGVIHQPIGDMDAEGNFLTAAIPGWHVNLRGEFTEEQVAALAPYIVTPESPVRVWS